MRRLLVKASSALLILSVAVGVAMAQADSGSEAAAGSSRNSLRGKYGCQFDSSSPGYAAPGTNESVHVGGIFTLVIDKAGTITQSNAVLSVDDGGAGPAFCVYQSGTGQIADAGNGLAGLKSAAISYQAAANNPALCPASVVSLMLNRTSKELVFVYSNSSGIVGSGSCGQQTAGPTIRAIACAYQIKGGAGVAVVGFNPALAPSKPGSGGVSAIETDVEDNLKLCPFSGVGTYKAQAADGLWTAILGPPRPGCSGPVIDAVSWVYKGDTIAIIAPGIVNASCQPK